MTLIQTIRVLQAAIADEDTDTIYAAVADLVELLGDQATSAIANALIAEQRETEADDSAYFFAQAA